MQRHPYYHHKPQQIDLMAVNRFWGKTFWEICLQQQEIRTYRLFKVQAITPIKRQQQQLEELSHLRPFITWMILASSAQVVINLMWVHWSVQAENLCTKRINQWVNTILPMLALLLYKSRRVLKLGMAVLVSNTKLVLLLIVLKLAQKLGDDP